MASKPEAKITKSNEHSLQGPADLIFEELKKQKTMEEGLKKQVTYEEIKKPKKPEGAMSLFSGDEIELKTDLSGKEIVAVTRLRFMAKRYNLKGVDEFCNEILRLKVSLDRKGRREYIEGLHAEERRDQARDLSPIAALLGGGTK